jgi:hypothetical protein
MGMKAFRMSGKGAAIAAMALCTAHVGVEAQGRRDRERETPAVEVAFRIDAAMERTIRAFYADRPASGVKALPPGIRKNLARGKPLPPGIAKQVAPSELVTRLSLPRGYDVVEVGLDVFIVEAATSIVHDILMDVIR